MPMRLVARVAFGLVWVSALSMLSSCAAPAAWTLTIDKVGPTYVPAIDIAGTIERVAAVTITGSPQLIAPLLQRVQAEGWKARLLDDGTLEIDPVGHSLDEVTGLNFQVENGEFGDLKFKVVMRVDRKATDRAQAH